MGLFIHRQIACKGRELAEKDQAKLTTPEFDQISRSRFRRIFIRRVVGRPAYVQVYYQYLVALVLHSDCGFLVLSSCM